jgi:hypothetical protein
MIIWSPEAPGDIERLRAFIGPKIRMPRGVRSKPSVTA